MKKVTLLWFAALLGLAMMLAGCGGGGGGTTDITPQLTPGIALTVGADSALPEGMSRNGISLTAALDDAGSNVTVINYVTGAVLKTGTLTNGQCTLTNIPSGLTVAVIITGKRDGKDFRLSHIIPNVPATNTTVELNPLTSLAAEAIASKLQNTAIDQQTYDDVMSEVFTYLGTSPDVDFSLTTGDVFTGTTLGSVDTTEIANILAAVPTTINSDIILAKNAVMRIQDAGFYINGMIADEGPNVQMAADQVFLAYADLGSRMDTLLMPAVMESLYYNDNLVFIFELPLGTAYTVTKNEWGDRVLTPNSGGNVSGQVTLTYVDTDVVPNVTYTVVGKPTLNPAVWTVTQTSSADASMEYKITMPPIGVADPLTNPSATVTITLADVEYPKVSGQPQFTFTGTLSAVGSNPYTSITYTGSLTSPLLTSTGTLNATFPSAVPGNARPGASVYDFPSSFRMTNGNISVTGDDRGTAYTVSMSGNIYATSAVVTADGYASIRPTRVEVSGSYSDTLSTLGFTGSITGNWANPATSHENVGTINASLRMIGDLTRTGYAAYHADVSFAISNGNLTTAITLAHGGYQLTGTGSAILQQGQDPTNVILTLADQNGVKFIFTLENDGSLAGRVDVGTTTGVATITESPLGGIRITYTDSTYDDLFF